MGLRPEASSGTACGRDRPPAQPGDTSRCRPAQRWHSRCQPGTETSWLETNDTAEVHPQHDSADGARVHSPRA